VKSINFLRRIQKDTNGLRLNILGNGVCVFAGVDSGLPLVGGINVPRETSIDGEAHESVQMGPIHLLELELLHTAQPSEDNNTSSCQPIAGIGELGSATDRPQHSQPTTSLGMLDVLQHQSEGKLPRLANHASEHLQRHRRSCTCAMLLKTPPRHLIHRLLQVSPIL